MRALSVAIGVLLALAAGVYFLGPKIYVRYFLDDLNCEPAVSGFARADVQSPAVTTRLEELFNEDQADRRALGSLITAEELMARDTQRRHEVLRYLSAPALRTAEEFYHAAMIFHHGGCSDHFELAHGLATLSIELGHEPAKWLHAATCAGSASRNGSARSTTCAAVAGTCWGGSTRAPRTRREGDTTSPPWRRGARKPTS